MGFEKIFVLDDELVIRKTLEEHLRHRRYNVASASNVADAQTVLQKDHFDIAFIDVRLPDGNGTQLIDFVSNLPNPPMMVVMSGYGTVESAVKCMRLGAFDYLIKPFSIEEVDVILERAESYNHLVKVNQFLSTENQDFNEILGESKPIINLRQMIKKVAVTEATVLITGENGTGKELVAQALHRASTLAAKPYIKVNCAAISETLIESEFFGHEKGAFTGAIQRREGRFELAHNGTILLDEISEISPRLQAKLLRVLQEKEFERVGGNKTIKVNARVIATTNRNLLSAVEKGDFREDLYYRLNVFPIHVPPLRERPADIPILAEAFLQRCIRKHGITVQGFSKEATQILIRHTWPGNVRELQNTVERAVILSENNTKIQSATFGITLPKNKIATQHTSLQPC